MNTAKLRIDLAQGLIEVEGPDTLVRTIYDDFKEHLGKIRTPSQINASKGVDGSGVTNSGRDNKAKESAPAGDGTKSRKRKPRESQVIVKELDLTKGKTGNLKEFYNRYEVKTNFDKNVIFVYYLQHELGLNGITDNHIFTCYRNVQTKLPGSFRQSLFDTARKGWLDTADMNNIELSTQGLNYLEHDLQKKAAK